MRKQTLATVLMLAASATTSAMAFDHKRGSGHHVNNFHASGMHNVSPRHRARLVRGAAGWREIGANFGGPSYRGGYVDLGPLGIMAACGLYRSKRGYCGPGYSVSTWTY